MARRSVVRWTLGVVVALASWAATAGPLPLEGPALGPESERTELSDLTSGTMSLREVRAAGLKIFSTPFRKADGFGDGPMNPGNPTEMGGRPTLGDGTAFLRINGLDSQTCTECHAFVSTTSSPPELGIGGFGTTVASPMFMPTAIDVDDEAGNGFAAFDGRLILPPHLFGVGGVQLLAQEMTEDLRALAAEARASPGTPVVLRTKGVVFGSVVADAGGTLDTSRVRGVDPDLVVRPFGRKGEFPTVGAFDRVALRFHMGMEPDEADGESFDADGDGVWGEIKLGELAALEIFLTTMERPRQLFPREALLGAQIFSEIGCAGCHRPVLTTRSRVLSYSEPLADVGPYADAVYAVDLTRPPASFQPTPGGGIEVPLFSDLKRHDLGPGLAESFQGGTDQQNREFVTAKLWGVGDSAPYLHDGRAHTLAEAIEMHGGEASEASDAFSALDGEGREAILRFLASLRLPRKANADVIEQ